MTNHIPFAEFRQRLKNTREAMLRQKFDALVLYSQKRSHITYLSGYHPNYHTNAALMLITAERDPTLWIKFAFDLPRAKATSWLEDIRTCASDEVGDVGGMIGKCADDIRSLRLEGARIGLVATDVGVDELTFSFREQICRQLPKAQLVPASDIVNELRLLKSQNEIALLRQAAQLAEVVVDSLRKSIRPGVKDRQATVTAEYLARLEGADQCDVIISTDPAFHALPPMGLEFRAGSPVNCEITVRYGGYWIQICRVFCIGKPSRPQVQVFEVCRDAYQAAVRAARPGTSADQVAEAAEGVIAAGGLKDCIPYGIGHGVGVDLPEPYSVDHECRGRLAPGMVLILHPAIWVPKQGAAFLGGPIAVTDNGALCLDNPASEMIVI
jgi:Xaa-Pro aminopeptidase